MSLPNEFLGSNHSFHPENIPPLVIPSAHSNSNFASTPAANNIAQFCGSSFFPNTLGYDVTMLPFMNTPQRPAHFNSPFVQQNKPSQPEVSSKDEVPQLSTSVNRTNNSFNNDVAAQSAYWPRQSQLNPYNVLSHEISSDQVEKSPYENVLNAHYIVQSLNNLNQLPMTDGDKKANQSRNKDSGMKKQPQSYAHQKSMNDMKMFQMQEEMGYRNGVINPGQVAKLDQSKLTNYKKITNEVPVSETAVTAARDYRTFKSEASLFNAAAAVVKYTGKVSKQFAQKAVVKTNPNSVVSTTAPLMKNQRGVSCSPLMAQKMADFHREDSRSSPLSSDDNMGEQMRYSSPNSIKEQDAVYQNLNTMNNVCHPSTGLVTPIIPNYRDQHQDMNCHMNGNKNKVTNQFAKLPISSSPNNSDTIQLNRKASFTSPYNLFNDQLNQAVSQKRLEKPPERVETQSHAQVGNNPAKMAMHSDVNSMMLPKQSPNGSVGYSSVIMRTDRNYETDEKMEKMVRQQRQQSLLWPNNESLKADKGNSYKPELAVQGQRNLLMGLTERQQSYFDNSNLCQPHITQNMTQLKCNSTKNTSKLMYDGGQQHTMETAQQMSQNADQQQLHHYQQYMPVKSTTPMNQPMLESTDLAEKSFSRKRRSPKAPEYQQNRDPPPAHVNMYQQQMQSTPYLMDNAAVNRYEVPNQYYSQSNMQSFNNTQAVPEQSHHQTSTMTSPAMSRMNSASPMRQMSQVAQTHTLSSYFATAQPSNPYSPSDYQVPSSSAYADPMQHYPSAEVPAYVPNVMNCEPPVDDSRPKVIVPDIEDEFKFLFDPSLRHYKEIARPAEEEALYRNKSAMLYRNNKIDFLTSYMNFLENNCESVETLSDANTVPMKTWNRNKIAYQPLLNAESNKDEPKPKPAPAPPKEPVKVPAAAVTKEPECNFENDPRYYPLPKSSDKRRLDSSSEDEFDGLSKKSKTSDNDAARKSSGEKPKKKVTFKKDIKTVRIFESGKKKVLKKEEEGKVKKSTKVVKTKLERTEKVKTKTEKSTKKNGSGEKIKPKVEKPVVEVKAVKPLVVPPKKRSTKDSGKKLFLLLFTFYVSRE